MFLVKEDQTAFLAHEAKMASTACQVCLATAVWMVQPEIAASLD